MIQTGGDYSPFINIVSTHANNNFHQQSFTMNIDQRSTKSDIVDAACEIVDSQAEKIETLQQQQTALIGVVGFLVVWGVLF
nr:hypothetical protein 24 [bacterium]